MSDNQLSLERYGIRWNSPTEPICTPMIDGYWTPWHVAHAEIEKLKAENERLKATNWFLLYDGTSCDGRGTPDYFGRTTDIDTAIKHLVTNNNPYFIGHVLVVTDKKTMLFNQYRIEELKKLKEQTK